MRLRKRKKLLSLFLALVLTFTTSVWSQLGTVKTSAAGNEDNVKKVTMDDTGYQTSAEEKAFSWDNATVYFLLTDRFKNGNTSNDNAYGRQDYSSKFSDKRATFHGGDFAGITQEIEAGYFDDLGVNAIWLSAPYEQIHGYIQGGESFYHQSYHGYYVLDYTETDEAFGTKEEFKKLVTTAHEHGIRIVMDIVMNHAGYSSIGDMNEFGYGTLKSGWNTFYNSASESLYSTYHSYVDYDSNASDWANWWGGDWIRSGVAGYPDTGESGSDLVRSLAGLPDFKTESTATVGIPKLLQNKWSSEGTYDTKVAKYGSSGTVRTYLCKWLSEWVETYGVDGFRCDTAKHVENASWKALKDSCVTALNNWRKNNPNEPGANWTDEFWMTGEAWDHGVNKDAYYTEGGFDSMINFSTCGGGSLTSDKLNDVYAGYDSSINSDPDFNVLSFMSSHDETVMSKDHSVKDMIYYGTAFLMLPGGVQIYYGDETYRKLVPNIAFDGYGEAGHSLRSDMNWDSIETDLLEHWQKVGTFRSNHIAVGAGKHTKLSGSPYTFSRVYNDDKVVVAMPSSAGTYDISVSGVFEDGTMVSDAYTGEAYQVSGGQVSVTCDENCTILLEGGGTLKPGLNASGKKTFSDETVSVKLISTLAKDAYYSVNGSEKKAYENGDTIEIGAGAAYGEKFTVTLTGTAEDGTALTNTVVFTKCEEPEISDGVYRLKVKKSEFSTCPNIYVWQDDADGNAVKYTGDWPGSPMSDDGDYWAYENEELQGEVNFILCNGSDKLTGDLSSTGSKIYGKDGTFTTIPVSNPAKITCKYVDANGKDLTGGLNVYRVGVVGGDYTVSAREISGYTLDSVEGGETGKFTPEEITITFIYKKTGEDPTQPSEDPTESSEDPTESSEDPTESSEDPTESSEDPTESSEDPTESSEDPTEPSEDPTESSEDPTESSEDPTEPSEDPTESSEDPTEPSEDPTQPSEDPTGPSEDPTEPSEKSDLEITGFSVSIASGVASVGDRVSLVAKTKGGEGKVQYRFLYKKSSTVLIKNYSTSNVAKWTPSAAATYELIVYVKDTSGKIVKKSIKNYVVNSKVKVSSFKVSPASKKVRKGKKVTLKMAATGGSKKYKYKFAYKLKGTSKIVTISNYSSKKSVTWKPKKAGKYTLYAYVKDTAKNTVAKKTISTYVVNK